VTARGGTGLPRRGDGEAASAADIREHWERAARTARDADGLSPTARDPHLQEVVNRTGDSSSLCVLDKGDIVYLAHVGTRRILRLEASVGTRYPAYPTSMGRVLLCHLAPDRLDRYFRETKFAALTDRTETSRAKLRKLVAAARSDGYAAVQDELAYGVVAVAVPVFDSQGVCVAAVNCSAHSMEIDKAKLVRSRLPILHETSRRITESLRHFPALSDSVRA